MLTTVVVCLTILWVFERARGLVVRRLEMPHGVERKPMPTDLIMAAMRESEPWAREQVLRAMQEAYESAGNWDAVRVRYGVSQ